MGTLPIFLYDALGRRIQKNVDGHITRYIYSGSRIVEERDVDGNTLANYVYGRGLDEPIAMLRDVDGDGTREPYYFQGDQQNSTYFLTNAAGQIVEAYSYGAVMDAYVAQGDGTYASYPNDFGFPVFLDPGTGSPRKIAFNGDGIAVFEATGTPIESAYGNPFLYNGREWDPELGMYWYRTRHLDPIMGRFTTPDPLGAWGDPMNLGNPYTYVGNNPWTYVDPFGLQSWPGVGVDVPLPSMGGDFGIGALLELGNQMIQFFIGGEANYNENEYRLPDRPGGLSGGIVGSFGLEIEDHPSPTSAIGIRVGEDSVPLLTPLRQSITGENLLGEPVDQVGAATRLIIEAGALAVSLRPALRSGTVAAEAGAASKPCATATTGSLNRNWPPNYGFSGNPARQTLEPGTMIDRYGDPYGRFLSPQGTSFTARSLPPEFIEKPINVYEVVKPLEVNAGPAAPWFGQEGYGMQYQTDVSIQNLIDSGVLRPRM